MIINQTCTVFMQDRLPHIWHLLHPFLPPAPFVLHTSHCAGWSPVQSSKICRIVILPGGKLGSDPA